MKRLARIRPATIPALALGIAFALLLSGCREELGPERMPTAHVSGRIHFRGQPLGGGWLEFHPDDGTVGKLRSTVVGPDGTFQTDRVPAGRVALQYVHPTRVPATIPRSIDLNVFERIALMRRDVTAGADNSLDIDLYDEWLLYLREKAAAL